MNNSNKYLNLGQTVLEILIALGIFTLSTTAALQLFFGGQSLSIDSQNSNLASGYAKESVEATRNIVNRNWSELTDGPHGLVFQNNEWMFASSSASDSQDIFTRSVEIQSLNDNVKIATTTVSWTTDPLRPQTLTLIEQLTKWQELNQSSCKVAGLSGNWANPVSVGSGDIGSGNEGTDVVAKLPYVFVSGVASSAAKPDIFVFDVSDPASPRLVESLDIGAGGINQIFIKDNYLYGASSNDSKELIIINIADPLNISVAGSLNLTGSTDALSVIAFSNTVAIGRTDSASKELVFIDVSNPASPNLISETATSGDINDFAETTDYLYAVSEESDEDIWIYNIANPAAPSLATTYDIPGTTEDLSVYLHFKGGSRNLLVGNEQNELKSIGATTTQLYVRSSLNVGGDVNDIVCVLGDLAFLATENSGKEFLIVNAANPDNLVEYGSLNYPQVATGIDFADNKVFMSVRSNNALRIISSSP